MHAILFVALIAASDPGHSKAAIAAFDRARVRATIRRISSCGPRMVSGSPDPDTGGIRIWIDDRDTGPAELDCVARLKVEQLTFWTKLDFRHVDNLFYTRLREVEDKAREAMAAIAARRIAAACGFRTVQADRDDLGTPSTADDHYVIEVRDDALTAEQRHCSGLLVLNELGLNYEVRHRAVPLEPLRAGGSRRAKLMQQQRLENARDELRRRLLPDPRKYRPDRQDPLQFARSLERLCGPRAAGAFRAVSNSPKGRRTSRTTWNRMVKVDNDTSACLAAAVVVAALPFDHLYEGD